MHRIGPWLGMDVHDCGSYVEPDSVNPWTGVIAPTGDLMRSGLHREEPSQLGKRAADFSCRFAVFGLRCLGRSHHFGWVDHHYDPAGMVTGLTFAIAGHRVL